MRLTEASATRGMTRLASSAIRCSIASIDIVPKRNSPSWANAARASRGGRSACWPVLIGAGPVWSADGEGRLDGGAAHLRTAEGSSARLLLEPTELDPWTWIPTTRRIADGTRGALRVGSGGLGWIRCGTGARGCRPGGRTGVSVRKQQTACSTARSALEQAVACRAVSY